MNEKFFIKDAFPKRQAMLAGLLVRIQPHTCSRRDGEPETEDHEFKASLDHTPRLSRKGGGAAKERRRAACRLNYLSFTK